MGSNACRQWQLGCIFYYIFRGKNGLGVLAQRGKNGLRHIYLKFEYYEMFLHCLCFPVILFEDLRVTFVEEVADSRFAQTENCSKKLIKSSLEKCLRWIEVCVLEVGWLVEGGDSTTFSSGYLTNVCTRPLLPFFSSSPPSDWLNWIKMTPIIGSSWGRCADPTIHI